MLVRVIFTFVFLALMSSEVWMMSKDRVAHDAAERTTSDTEQNHFATLLQTERETQATLVGSFNARTLVAQTQIERQKQHRVSDELLQLKSRTAILSSGIFSLLLDRNMMAPPIPRPATWEQDVAKWVPYDQQTTLFYEQKYGADVRRAVEDLKNHGLEDQKLEAMARNPINVQMVRVIASHLAAQAERITPDGIKPLTHLLIP